MNCLFDTDTCIATINHRSERLAQKLKKLIVGDVSISSITLAELQYGVANSQRPEVNQKALDHFLQFVVVLDWPSTAAKVYGEIRAQLTHAGKLIGGMDLLIAAHALSLKLPLVTNNEKEFKRVPGLRVENWLR